MAGVRAAVDVQRLAGHELRRLQVQDRLDHFLHRAHPPDRVQPGQERMRLRRVHRGLDHARRDRVHPDAPVGVLDCQRPGDGGAEGALIKGATDLLKDVLDKDPKLTFVIIEEVELENWGVGGLPTPEYRRKQAEGSPG